MTSSATPPADRYAALGARMLHPDILTPVLGHLDKAAMIPLLDVDRRFVGAAAPSLFRRMTLPEDWAPLTRRGDGGERAADDVALLVSHTRHVLYLPHATGDACAGGRALSLPPGARMRVCSSTTQTGRWTLAPGRATLTRTARAKWVEAATCACERQVAVDIVERRAGMCGYGREACAPGLAADFVLSPFRFTGGTASTCAPRDDRVLVLGFKDGTLDWTAIVIRGDDVLEVSTRQRRRGTADAVAEGTVDECATKFAKLPVALRASDQRDTAATDDICARVRDACASQATVEVKGMADPDALAAWWRSFATALAERLGGH